MKKYFLILCVLISFVGIAQETKSPYKKVYAFGEHHKDWALVKTITNTFGFINRENKEVVPAIYSKIYSFETKENTRKYAMVKNVAGAYGFIDEKGKEVIKAIYFKKEEVIQKLNIFLNGL